MTINELKKTHPLYDEWNAEWLFYMRSYFGGKHYRDGDYLQKHPLESEENYTRRKDLAFFYNLCAPVVDIFNSLLYNTQPERTYGSLANDSLFKSFLADADFNGNTYEQFIMEAQRFASMYGRVSILIDKSSFDVTTRATQEQFDIRPYMAIITPENILDWKYISDVSGRKVLGYVKIQEDVNTYKIWTPFGWELYVVEEGQTGEIKPTLTGEHDLGQVPIVNLYNKTTLKRMLGVSDLEDIAYINKNTYSLCSDATEIVENTAFPMLAVPEERGGDDDPKKVGPKNILQFDPNEQNSKPYWLETTHTSLEAVENRIERNAREIYAIAQLAGIKTNESIQPMSGIALSQENQQRNASLSEKAVNMEQGERKILELVARWQGKEKFDGEIKYIENYDITDLNADVINILSTLQQAGLESKTMVRELHKKLSRDLLPKVAEDTQDTIDDEIKKFTNPPFTESGKQTQVARQTGGDK